jgi:hypothetical protein
MRWDVMRRDTLGGDAGKSRDGMGRAKARIDAGEQAKAGIDARGGSGFGDMRNDPTRTEREGGSFVKEFVKEVAINATRFRGKINLDLSSALERVRR